MRTSQKITGIVTTIGIDIGKNTFHLVGLALYGHGGVYDWSLQANHKRTLTGRSSKASS